MNSVLPNSFASEGRRRLSAARVGALLILLCVTTPLAVAQAPVPEILHYTFDQDGTAVPNRASSPPAGTTNGTIQGLYTQNVTMPNSVLKALLSGGGSSSTNFVNTGWATNLTGSWTISFFTNNIPSTTTTYYVLGDSTATSLRAFTGGVAGASNWIFRGPILDHTVTGAALSATTMTTFVYDAQAGVTRSYINGTLANTVNQTAPTISGAGPFKVGGYGTSAALPAGALLADFRVYNRALTQAEITAIYEAGTKLPQTLTLPPQTLASRVFTLNSTFAIDPLASSATPNSGNPIVYSSLTDSVCSVTGTTVTMLQDRKSVV